ncbi:hypothetical protein L6452_27616 [Arctium lappa]|uniref:Uncharacterized protein n=1 Tax=Arctium lappa TaxID=4217 RepID=A0ACB8ZXI4_ARCLA|nr:hypothetical protein L6452_27616 [Arctium lappa]
MVEESVFDCGENNNRRSGEEEDGTTIKGTAEEKAIDNEYKSEKEERVLKNCWKKRVSVGAGDLPEFIPESEEEEELVKEGNDEVLDCGKDTKEKKVRIPRRRQLWKSKKEKINKPNTKSLDAEEDYRGLRGRLGLEEQREIVFNIGEATGVKKKKNQGSEKEDIKLWR